MLKETNISTSRNANGTKMQEVSVPPPHIQKSMKFNHFLDQLISMVDQEQAIMCQSAGYVYSLKNGSLTEEQQADKNFIGEVQEISTPIDISK